MTQTMQPGDGGATPPALPGSNPPPLPGATPPGEPVTVTWSGNPWSLAGLGLVNFLLTVVTLGIYHFWAKTEVRRRVTSSIRLNGEPLEYLGTGRELFLGFVIVFLFILLPALLVIVGAQLWLGENNPSTVAIILPIYALFGYLYGVAVYRARRYRRSRISWRGIRGAMVGSSLSFGWGFLWTYLLVPFTWGWLTPWRDNYLHRTLTRDTRFGDRPFTYTGKAGPLYPSFAIAFMGQIGGLLVLAGAAFAVLWPMSAPIREVVQSMTADGGKIDWSSPELAPYSGLIAGMVGIGIAFLVAYILLVGILWSMYAAFAIRYFSAQTGLGAARFRLDVSGFQLFWLFLANSLMSMLTLTILGPVAEARVARYFIRRLSIDGPVDFAGIAQSAQRLSRTGEGLAEAFDVDFSSYFILSI